MEDNIKPARRPSMAAFVVAEEGGASYWRRIGAAFDHRDGKGKTILVDAWPVGERLVLRDIAEADGPEIA